MFMENSKMSKKWTFKRRATRSIKNCLHLLSVERPAIARSEFENATKSDEALIAFAIRHEISTDWRLLGDLHGLHRMTIWARQGCLFTAGQQL